MEKVYDFKEERKWLSAWIDNDLFKTDLPTAAAAFSILLPPSFISAPPGLALALTLTLPDIIARRKKMQGVHTLWLPWLDGGRDTSPVKGLAEQLGLALDWHRAGFNTSEEMERVAARIFVRLYKEGAIFRKTTGSKQWYLNASGAAGRAIAAVETGEITFNPGRWSRLCRDWLKNLKDVCISCAPGQGMPIPAYRCGVCQHLTIEENLQDRCGNCGAIDLHPEPAALDSWFIAALWHFAALGWRHNSPDFATFYPASLMITGADTFFLQVGRMILLGLLVSGTVPFREVLVRGMTGEKKNRAKHDSREYPLLPADIITTYSADALRFALAALTGSGRDVSISLSRLKGVMAFANKIWNAARFVIDSPDGMDDPDIDFSKLTDPDKWILHVLNTTIVKVNDLMDGYHIAEAARLIYRFARHELCGWYLECFKNDAHNPDSRRALKLALLKLLQLLHPFMPFITEELYQKMNTGGKPFLLQTRFPVFHSEEVFSHEFAAVEMMKKLVMATRKIRMENKIHPGKRIPVYLNTNSKKERDLLAGNITYFNRLTRSAKTDIVPDFSGVGKGFKGACFNWDILLPLDNDEERMKELQRQEKELRKIDGQVSGMEKKLSRPRFLEKTPAAEVLELKKKLQAAITKRGKLQDVIADLS